MSERDVDQIDRDPGAELPVAAVAVDGPDLWDELAAALDAPAICPECRAVEDQTEFPNGTLTHEIGCELAGYVRSREVHGGE